MVPLEDVSASAVVVVVWAYGPGMRRLRIPWILRSCDVARMTSVGLPPVAEEEEGGKVGSVKGRFEEEVEGRLEVGGGSAGLFLAFLGFCLLGLPPPPPLGGLVLGSFVAGAGAGDLEGSGLVTTAGESVVGSGSVAVVVVLVAGRPISLKRVSTSGSVRGAREVAISVKVLPLPLRWRIAMSSAVVHGAGGDGSAPGGAAGVGSAGGAGSGAAGAGVSDVVAMGGLRRWGWGIRLVREWREGVRGCGRGRVWGLEGWGGLWEGIEGGEVGISSCLCEDSMV